MATYGEEGRVEEVYATWPTQLGEGSEEMHNVRS